MFRRGARVPGTVLLRIDPSLHALKMRRLEAAIARAEALDVERGKIRNVRLALGGVAHKPWRAFEAERILAGASVGAASFRRAADAELAPAKGLAHNGFKIELAKRTIVGVLSELAERS